MSVTWYRSAQEKLFVNAKNRLFYTVRPLDGLMKKISSNLPVRLTLSNPVRAAGIISRKRDLEKIRKTFAGHQPPIHVGKHLGSGGFSDVFEAVSNYDGVTRFAIKILRSELLKVRKGEKHIRAAEEMRIKDVKKRFRNESFVQWHLSQSASPAVSESIVRVYDHGEFDSRTDFRFILMERMGSTLRDFINRNSELSRNPASGAFKVAIMRRIAEIISLVHSEGIFHRDIKPENILFPDNEHTNAAGREKIGLPGKVMVKLADFGTVRWVRSTNDRFDGEIIGSQYYLSPEQIMNPRHQDPRTDIYSFGVVCYELLYGIHPKGSLGQKMSTRLLEKLAIEPPQPKTPPPGFEKINEIILKCMNSVRDRYQSMGEVVMEFDRAVSGSME
jgi:serine/threonine protein kinase